MRRRRPALEQVVGHQRRAIGAISARLDLVQADADRALEAQTDCDGRLLDLEDRLRALEARLAALESCSGGCGAFRRSAGAGVGMPADAALPAEIPELPWIAGEPRHLG
jgi:hypothetical protein